MDKQIKSLAELGTGGHLMAAISGSGNSEYVIRWTEAVARRFGASWSVINVASVSSQDQGAGVVRNLRLAEQAGAELIKVSANDIAGTIVRNALIKKANVLVIGKAEASGRSLREKASMMDQILERSGDLDVIVLQGQNPNGEKKKRIWQQRRAPSLRGILYAAGLLGGLGIISFTSLLLLVPGHRLPFRRLRTIKSFSVDGVEHDPAKIVRSIVIFTLASELAGAILLLLLFRRAGVADSWFVALFHSVSAFCNAGFSTFSDSLERFRTVPGLLAVTALLITGGGIGFVVLYDVSRWLRRKKRQLSFHTKLILGGSLILVAFGTLAFLLLEGNTTMAGLNFWQKFMNALFQAVTPRTAGFNAIHQADLGQVSKMLTMALMFIGGAPGSIAGGIKVSTAFIVLMIMLRRANEQGEIQVFHKRLSPEIINSAVVYFIKAIFLLICAIGLIVLFESARGLEFGDIAFEVISAFGTVGLSLDLTAGLSAWSKLVLIFTMFTGRVGLLAVVYLGDSKRKYNIAYPEADILIG